MGSAIIIVGGTGTGKTTFVHSRLEQVKNKNALFIWDVNREYEKFTRGGGLPSRQEFTETGLNTRNGVFVFEEATIYFKTKSTDENLTEMMVRKRHTGNTIFLVFHSLRAIPKYIYDLSNYIVVFKTNDGLNTVKQKFDDENLMKVVEEVQGNKEPHYYYIHKIY